MAQQAFFLILAIFFHCILFSVPPMGQSEINAQNQLGLTQLHIAAKNKNFLGAKQLLKNGAAVNAMSSGTFYKKWTPLFWAVRSNFFSMVKLLIQHGALVNCTDEIGQTPLHISCQSKNLEIIELLLANGARIDTQDLQKKMPLYYAIINGNFDAITLLITHGNLTPKWPSPNLNKTTTTETLSLSPPTLIHLCTYHLAFTHHPKEYAQLPTELIECILKNICPSDNIRLNDASDIKSIVLNGLCERHLANIKTVCKNKEAISPRASIISCNEAKLEKITTLFKQIVAAKNFADLPHPIQEKIKKKLITTLRNLRNENFQ